ncbi:hypothetical protein [Undibacter mobilis]|uniref:Uncharacterized protein n=1 Tax=Undibacter mobilis TaxID=2292256 RepID=A0A371B717_9BRAD|nr:hypothetical protein [Undibacter mobilis]RDV03344.1 hypothetical protein DXH78_01310 [Undibacter mobilis]
MRLWAIACALFLCVAAILPASAQSSSRGNRDHIVFPPDRDEIEYRKTDEIPRQLRAVIGRECNYAFWLKDIPIKIVRPAPKGRAIAMVPCGNIIPRSMAFTDLTSHTPRSMAFAVKVAPNGFGVSDLPGYLEWDSGTQTMTATAGTDMIGSTEWRYSYRYSHIEGHSAFVLTRIEHRKTGHPLSNWLPYWEASVWAEPR